jgi:dipeptidyl aminopeptidase/acylaminoacyl peptidase
VEAGAPPRFLTEELDLWPESPVVSADGRSVFFVADERGRRPAFRVGIDGGRVTRLTAEGACSDLVPSPDGTALYALHARLDRPWEVVALDPRRADQEPRRLTRLTEPALAGVPMGHTRSLAARGAGGREVHSFLVLPEGEPPPQGRPLLLWIHGGPLGAWTDEWHWRWNPRLFAARGFAVLLVNPRLSTGYGQAFIEEGHARWGAEPYEDLMAAVEAAAREPGIDAGRVAAMGGSFGGYMVNWIAGRTERFRCLVSHAGLWHLVGFHGTTDFGPEWEREFGGDPYRHPETYERWSPHRDVRSIKTPILLVHGERDYRVSVAEALQMFTALKRMGVPSRFLYFPDENHWILKPPNIRTWHETIWTWLDRWV